MPGDDHDHYHDADDVYDDLDDDPTSTTTSTTTTTTPTTTTTATTTTSTTTTTPPPGTTTTPTNPSGPNTPPAGETSGTASEPETKPELQNESAKQAKGVRGATGAHVRSNPNELPFTGFPTWLLAAIGSALLAAGLLLRKVSAQP